MQMNCSHSGAHLSQMLYNIVNRLEIIHKVRTCTFSSHRLDHLVLGYRLATLHVIMWRTTPPCCRNPHNATNLRLGLLLMSNAGRSGMHPLLLAYCADTSSQCFLRCLAHIINLAVQAVISACSKLKYYNGNPTDNHLLEDLVANKHDEIGIIHAICIKVCIRFLQLTLSADLWVRRLACQPSRRSSSRLFNYATTNCWSTYFSTWTLGGAPPMSCYLMPSHNGRWGLRFVFIFLVITNLLLLCYTRQLMSLSSGLEWKKSMLTSGARFPLLPCTTKSGHAFVCSVILSRYVFIQFTFKGY